LVDGQRLGTDVSLALPTGRVEFHHFACQSVARSIRLASSAASGIARKIAGERTCYCYGVPDRAGWKSGH